MDKDLVLTTPTTVKTIIISDPDDEVDPIRR